MEVCEMTTLLQAAEHDNDVEAQVRLSQLYEQSTSIALSDHQRERLSFEWCHRAAQQGHLQAQVHLGNLYYRGIGTPQNYTCACYWYRQAAEAGDRVAQHCLGMMLKEGKGVEEEEVVCCEDDEMTTDTNTTTATTTNTATTTTMNLTTNTNMTTNTNGTTTATTTTTKAVRYSDCSSAEAGPWEEKDHGEATAETEVNGRAQIVDEVEVEARANAAAVIWIRRSAEQGFAIAQHELGRMYEEGKIGMEAKTKVIDDQQQQRQQDDDNDTLAVHWYRRAADQHFGPAMTSLGLMFQRGRGGLRRDPVRAMDLFRRAADLGFPGAQFHLSIIDKDHEGGGAASGRSTVVERNEAEAVRWLRCAAERGLREAQTRLGVMYKTGQGVTHNDKLAAYWYHRSAVQGCVVAQTNLGLMYRDGHGLEQNDLEAATWFFRAAQQGSTVAQAHLGKLHESVGHCRNTTGCDSVSNSSNSNSHGSDRIHSSNDSIIIDNNNVQQSHVEAAQGLARAQFHLGWRYQTAKGGVDQDSVEAVAWYQRATDQGCLEAMHHGGQGVEQDKEQGMRPVCQAADVGDACTRFHVGMLVEQERGGGGVPLQDHNAETTSAAAATVWYLRAAYRPGHSCWDAQTSLGTLWKHGLDSLSQSNEEAVAWVLQAPERGNDAAQGGLGGMYLQGRGADAQQHHHHQHHHQQHQHQQHQQQQQQQQLQQQQQQKQQPCEEGVAVAWFQRAAAPRKQPLLYAESCWQDVSANCWRSSIPSSAPSMSRPGGFQRGGSDQVHGGPERGQEVFPSWSM
ncbi:hypothetical protein DFQ27_001938 [Actinomortierella ambigua]|uniref:Uncharacterized protein n=1 Tax=Actinomortierella ambigua TaxID=1343610 RepID=A0A9P6UCT6_9FUNG|nr:hypothetical protein DFQ27_001938 [Actinomortierella ambigua]